jgi:hypothetical protein
MRKWALLGVVAVSLLTAAVCLLRPAPRFSQAYFDRLSVGMTQEEVEAVLGPLGDYRAYRQADYPPPAPTTAGEWKVRTDLPEYELLSMRVQRDENGAPILPERAWQGHTFYIRVAFGGSGRAVACWFGRVRPPKGLSLYERAVAWLFP